MTGATRGAAGTVCPMEHLSSPTDFSGVRVARFFVFCVVFCRSLFVLFHLLIVLSVLLQFIYSDYPFVIFLTFFCLRHLPMFRLHFNLQLTL